MSELFGNGVQYLDGLPGHFRTNSVSFYYNNIFFHSLMRFRVQGYLFVLLFKCFNGWFDADEIVDIIITIEQTGFLVIVYVKTAL